MSNEDYEGRYKCPNCRGKGRVSVHKKMDEYLVTCPICMGEGYLNVTVVKNDNPFDSEEDHQG